MTAKQIGSDGNMVAAIETPPCIVCGRKSQVGLLESESRAAVMFITGLMKVQEAFPDWPADKRELVISGTHPACWDRLFGDD